MEQQKVDLDALEAALAKATPGEWHVTLDDTTYYSTDDGPCDVAISEINRLLHSPEWAEADDFEQDVANAEAIVLAHNALPALIAELRHLRARITPEVIGEKHRDGNWWLVWDPGIEQWMKCRFECEQWNKSGTMREPFLGTPTHVLPMPPAPEAQ